METKELKLDEKIYEILHVYKENNAKFWKLDTDVMKSWDKFIKIFNEKFKYSNFNITNFNIKMQATNNNKRYYFLIDNINLTPRSKDVPWSWTALGQFLRIGKVFGFFSFDEKSFSKENERQSFDLCAKINILLKNDFSWLDLLLYSLKETLSSNIKYFKNFGLSLLAYSIFMYDEKILRNLNGNDIKFIFIRNSKKEMDFNSAEWAKQVKIMSTTYENLAIIFCDKFEYIINELYSYIKNHNYELKKNEKIMAIINDFEELDISGNELTKTQSEALVKTRRGQEKFKANLYKIYPKCILSDIDIPELLIASHIVPWSQCNNSDKLSPFNGFLMSASIDKLFDSNLISFDENGFIYYSEKLKKQYPNYKEILNKIGIKNEYLLGMNSKSIFLNINKEYHSNYKQYLSIHLNETKKKI